ncbi:MAG: hypothetical protein ACR2MM_03705 [Flavobacteriaceae bacterium]
MNDLIKFTFDFFGHVLPGSVIIFSISLLHPSNESLRLIFENAGMINASTATALIITSYILGFAVNPFGRYLYRTLGFKLWNNQVENKVDMFVSDKFVLVRHFSPENFKKIEAWFTYCAMSHNLSLACLILFLVCGLKIIFLGGSLTFWISILILSAFLFFVFLYRAVTFYQWANHDLNAAVSCLNLKEKGME